jgi:hypothetical protein
MSRYLPFVFILAGVLVGAPGVGHAQSTDDELRAAIVGMREEKRCQRRKGVRNLFDAGPMW